MKRILSLGAGVQSTTVLLMSCKGILPKLDCAIFADTQWEPKAVYEHLEWLKGESERHGIPVHIVTAGNLRKEAIEFRELRKSADGKRFASLPVYVDNPDGSSGIVRRQCTSEYKIEPIEKFMRRSILGLAHRQRAPREPVIEHWFGISADEVYRMTTSREPWKVNRYPLVKDLAIKKPHLLFEQGYTRGDCIRWLREHYPERKVPRSACIGCPFHSDEEWLSIKSNPEEWKDAVEFDYALRSADRQNAMEKFGKKPMVGQIYLHRSRVPLDLVEFTPGRDDGGGMGNECFGMCGV
jgi:hypothetical protein